jgi:tRNA-2-methylthio-N6-dimethylallyladenosine synthase
MGRRYFIRTFGCQMNVHDSERAAGVLETLGYRPARDEAAADLVLFNTCAVRENADNKLYGALGRLKPLKEQRPDLTLVVGGCLAQKDKGTIAERAPFVDVVYGTHNLVNLPALLAQADSASVPVVEILDQIETFPSALPARREVRHHAWVSISVGCSNNCSFCIVPSLRGPEKSRRIGEIVDEVQDHLADGVLEVTLLGQNVNSYGRDAYGKPMFADLLRELGRVDGLERVRFTSPHPRDFTLDVLEAMADTANVCEHLHLPLQSGSDRILRAMRRSYRSRRYLELVDRAREMVPGCSLTTDIIVGFPGETEEDFVRTVEVCDEVGFDQAYTFQYSPRPGTDAAEMDDQVPPEVVKERYLRLEDVTRRWSERRHAALVGDEVEVLVESVSKTDPGRFSGRTRGNHLIHLPRTDGCVPGDFAIVRVAEATANYALGTAPLAVRRTAAAAAGAAPGAAAAPAPPPPRGGRGPRGAGRPGGGAARSAAGTEADEQRPLRRGTGPGARRTDRDGEERGRRRGCALTDRAGRDRHRRRLHRLPRDGRRNGEAAAGAARGDPPPHGGRPRPVGGAHRLVVPAGGPRGGRRHPGPGCRAAPRRRVGAVLPCRRRRPEVPSDGPGGAGAHRGPLRR